MKHYRVFPSRQTVAGFTLIELMVVVAVVAILAAVAYPSYQDSVLKGRRAEARAALADFLQQQERYLTQRNTYDVPITAGDTTVPFKTYSGDGGPAGAKYLLGAAQCVDGGGTTLAANECVQVFAVPANADPMVGTLQVTSTGVKTCTGTSKAGTPPTSKLCWP